MAQVKFINKYPHRGMPDSSNGLGTTPHDTLIFKLRANFCNAWPKFKILLDQTQVMDYQCSQEITEINIEIPKSAGPHHVELHRYGKDHQHMIFQNDTIIADQVLEIVDVMVNGVRIPEYILGKHTRFCFQDQTHMGSRYFGPNGVWSWEYSGSLVTWVLDQKILHEAQYTQDYELPWSYNLGPDSVNKITTEISELLTKLENTKFNE